MMKQHALWTDWSTPKTGAFVIHMGSSNQCVERAKWLDQHIINSSQKDVLYPAKLQIRVTPENGIILAFRHICSMSHPGRKVLAECTVDIGDVIRLTTKDDGRIVNLTDTNRDVSSLRTYILSNLLESHTVQRVHSLLLSYNRNALEFDRKWVVEL